MAQNTPWRLKNSNIFWGGPPDPPGGGAPPSHLALHAKMAAVTPSLVTAINTFVPGTSNLNKNPAKWGTGNVFTSRGGCERHEQFNLVFVALLPQSAIMLSR